MALFDSWAPVDFEDAMSLLGTKFCANQHYREELAGKRSLQKVFKKIRAKAVRCLEKQNTDTIQSIMLQLVQAYRYEYFEDSDLENFLLNEKNGGGIVFHNKHIANDFHWLVHLEKENKDNNSGVVLAKYQELYDEFYRILRNSDNEKYAEIERSLAL